MWSQRQTVDFSLQRNQAVRNFSSTNPFTATNPCVADPMLIRAALHHGEETEIDCPICQSTTLVTLHYVFGAELGQYSGRIKSLAEVNDMAKEVGEFKVCAVEVCPSCGWNFLIKTWLMGDGKTRRPPRKQRTTEDIY